MEQRTQEWLEMRKKYIGGSDAPVIMGVCTHNKTPFKLWEEKLDLRDPDPINPAMQRGIDEEPIAREAYIKSTGIHMKPKVIFHKEHSFRMASVDGISDCGKYVLEIKCVGLQEFEDAKIGIIHEKHIPQFQHILDTTEAEVLHYWAWFENQGILNKVYKDEKYCERLYEKEREFYEKIVNFDPPQLTHKDYTKYEHDKEFLAYVLEAEKIKRIEDLCRVRKEKNREKLKEKCKGQNAEGYGAKFFKTIEPGRINVKKLLEDYPLPTEILDKYRGDMIVKWTFRGRNGKTKTEGLSTSSI